MSGTAQPVDSIAPLTPADCDLTNFQYMPIEVARLQKSKSWRIIARRDPALAFYMMNLWLTSWHERPAGSLEDDDDQLADQAMCDPAKWSDVKAHVLRGWIKCSDGRLYHRVVAEKVNEAWAAKQSQRNRTAAATEARKTLKSPAKNRRKGPRQRDDYRNENRDDNVTSTKGIEGKGIEGNRSEVKGAAAARETPPPLARLCRVLNLEGDQVKPFTDFPALLENWQGKGCDAELDVWPTIERIAARGKPVNGPSYFVDAVIEARDARLAAPPGELGKRRSKLDIALEPLKRADAAEQGRRVTGALSIAMANSDHLNGGDDR